MEIFISERYALNVLHNECNAQLISFNQSNNSFLCSVLKVKPQHQTPELLIISKEFNSD